MRGVLHARPRRSAPPSATSSTPGRDDEQQLAGVPDLPGKPAQLVPSFGHRGLSRLSITRSGALGSSWSWAGDRRPGRRPASTRRLGALPAVPLDRGDEGVHERRVELRARPLAQLGDRLVDRPRAAVGPGGGHRVERVGDREHPGELGDLVARQAHRVAPAVDPLVVVHDPGQRLVEEPDLPDDVQAAHRVQLDRRVLLLGQRARSSAAPWSARRACRRRAACPRT